MAVGDIANAMPNGDAPAAKRPNARKWPLPREPTRRQGTCVEIQGIGRCKQRRILIHVRRETRPIAQAQTAEGQRPVSTQQAAPRPPNTVGHRAGLPVVANRRRAVADAIQGTGAAAGTERPTEGN